MKRMFSALVWFEVVWSRPYEFKHVLELLTHIAGTSLFHPLVWEIRGSGGHIRYLLGVDKLNLRAVKMILKAHGSMQFANERAVKRAPITTAKQLKISHPTLSLNTDNAIGVARAALAAFAQLKKKDELVLQIIIGPAYTPSSVPNKVPDPHASWLNIIAGNVPKASRESRNLIKEKMGHHGFACVIRIGANNLAEIANAHIRDLLCALRTLESSGVRISAVSEKIENINQAHVPWHFPYRLSVRELANFFLLPIGEEDLPGVVNTHPKLLMPPKWLHQNTSDHDLLFAKSTAGGDTTKLNFGISARDSLEHTIVLGPTGSGKSNVLLSMIMANINAGRSLLVIDPKADLVNDILARIPESRENDVVVIDPSDVCPVGVNPLSLCNSRNQHLVADAILAVFKEIFADSWGVRSQDIISSALITLSKMKGASLLMLPTLLTNDQFRKKALKNIDDKIGLEPFWHWYESTGVAERSQIISPVLNKMRQFLLRPGLRNVLGQAEPKFSLSDLFDKPRIVLVPLNKGIVGAESARLLGSLIVGLTWTLALNRAKDAPHSRQIVNIYIDELQDYLSLPTDLSDALAQARGLGVGLILAHQYRNQLSPSVRAGIDANARNKIIFGLNGSDAKEIAGMAPELEPIDFMLLPRYSIYTNLQVNGRGTGWMSGQTLPPTLMFRSAAEFKAQSMHRYGQDVTQTEKDYEKAVGIKSEIEAKLEDGKGSIGRKKR